ncbi:alcohol dehydrogenase [Lachnellula hyalina]|uniref:Alcohol dehydrogenase n=1 Tax=Lachnellula hyalina TaxID=1316788 RepID=A0A8H8R0S3_9HELO|nr:alcohol dehydrogenase [Lachnellula hyalina]TVY25655.1 alcohol dehydrogenase [Lachnellula hyalina]
MSSQKTEAPTPTLSFDIPKKCKAGVVVNEGPDFQVEVRDVDVPEIGQNECLIKLNATGLCSTDIHWMMNSWAVPKMSAMGVQCAGHEGAGVIVKVGSNVKRLKVGQRAGLKPIESTCGACELCRSGRETYCFGARLTGLHCDGTESPFEEMWYNKLTNDRLQAHISKNYTTLIPDGVSDYVAGPAMCSASTVYASIKAANLSWGQWAVFPGGGGGVGIQGVQLAVAMGLRPLVVDTGDEKRRLSMEMGAEHFVDFKESKDPIAEVLSLTDGGAHAVFCTAAPSYPTAQKYLGLRAGAQLMCIGLPPAGKFHIDVNPTEIVSRGQSIRGTFVGSMAEVDEALGFAQRGKLRLTPTVVGLSKFNESVQKLKRGEVAGRIVVDFNIE